MAAPGRWRSFVRDARALTLDLLWSGGGAVQGHTPTDLARRRCGFECSGRFRQAAFGLAGVGVAMAFPNTATATARRGPRRKTGVSRQAVLRSGRGLRDLADIGAKRCVELCVAHGF